MKEFIDKLISRLEEVHNINNKMKKEAYKEKDWETFELFTYRNEGVYSAISIVNQLAEEYNNGWITDREPTKEECGNYGNKEFQVTIPQPDGEKTIAMDFVYEIIKGKEVGRWKWSGRLSPWEVLAWKPLDAPYQPKDK